MFQQQELFKEPKNNPKEMAVLELLRSRGWNVERNGFPDYMIEKDGIVKGIEVKPIGGKLRKSQRKMKKLFKLMGIPYLVFEVKDNLEIQKSPESD